MSSKGVCSLCKINFSGKLSKFEVNRRSGVYMMLKNLTDIKISNWDTTCDNCFLRVEEVAQLYELIYETEKKIKSKLTWIRDQIATPTPEEEEQELQGLIDGEVKVEPTDDGNIDLDLEEHYSGGVDVEIDPDLNFDMGQMFEYETVEEMFPTVIKSSPICAKVSNSTSREKRACKRKVPLDEPILEKEASVASRSKRCKSQEHESIQVHIQKKGRTKTKPGTEDSFTLILDSIKSPKLAKRHVTRNVEDLPEARITLQDFVKMLPSQTVKQLHPLVDCRFNVVKLKKIAEYKQSTVDASHKDDDRDPDFENDVDNPDEDEDSDFKDTALNKKRVKAKTRRKRTTMPKTKISSNSDKSSSEPKSKKRRGRKTGSRMSRIPVPEVNFRDLNSLTVVDGRKYFLHYEFEATSSSLFCGFPDCNFISDSTDVDTCMVNHIKKQHFPELEAKESSRKSWELIECRICAPSTPTQVLYNFRDYRKHVQSEHPLNYATDSILLAHNPCPTCGKPFEYKNAHTWTHYNSTESRALVAQGFPDPRELKRNCPAMNTASPCSYPGCPKIFRSKYHLQQHLPTHTAIADRSKLICELCGYSVTTQQGLTLHILRHTQGKPKSCTICPSKFFDQSHLNQHMIRSHGSYEDRKFVCELCGLKFSTSNYLKNHGRAHKPKDWRPFVCHLCPEAYRSRKNLNRHIATTHGAEFVIKAGPGIPKFNEEQKNDRPVYGPKQMYPCELCGDKVFELRSRLTKHLKQRHPEED